MEQDPQNNPNSLHPERSSKNKLKRSSKDLMGQIYKSSERRSKYINPQPIENNEFYSRQKLCLKKPNDREETQILDIEIQDIEESKTKSNMGSGRSNHKVLDLFADLVLCNTSSRKRASKGLEFSVLDLNKRGHNQFKGGRSVVAPSQDNNHISRRDSDLSGSESQNIRNQESGNIDEEASKVWNDDRSFDENGAAVVQQQNYNLSSSQSIETTNSLYEHRRAIEAQLVQQRLQLTSWLREDSLFGFTKAMLKQDFTQGTPKLKYNIWRNAQFSCGQINNIPHPIVLGEWVDSVMQTSSKGLFLKHQIFQPRCQVNLRSFAVKIQSTIRLYGNTSAWIFTRLKDPEQLQALTPIIIFRKIVESQRLFCMIGALQLKQNMNDLSMSTSFSQNHQFKFYKSQEIPLFYYDASTDMYHDRPSDKQINQDFTDLQFTLIDNGDDRVCVQIQLGKDKFINIVSEMFLPESNEESRVMIGGAGHCLYLRNLQVRQTLRNAEIQQGIIQNNTEKYDCCCNII